MRLVEPSLLAFNRQSGLVVAKYIVVYSYLVPRLSDIVILDQVLLKLFKLISTRLVLEVILILLIRWNTVVASNQVVATLNIESSLSRRRVYPSVEAVAVIKISNLIRARVSFKEVGPLDCDVWVNVECQCARVIEHELIVR